MISTLGGLLGVLTAINAVIAKYFGKILLESELIESLFFDSSNKVEKEDLKKNKKLLQKLNTISKDK